MPRAAWTIRSLRSSRPSKRANGWLSMRARWRRSFTACDPAISRPTRPKVEAAVRAASDALDAGGERAPLIEHDPRQPRHGVPALEEEAWT